MLKRFSVWKLCVGSLVLKTKKQLMNTNEEERKENKAIQRAEELKKNLAIAKEII